MSDASDAWSPRLYRADDDERALALLTAAFDGWPKVEIAVDPIEHLRWKLDSADDAHRYHAVAEAGTRIVGLRGFFVQRVKLRGRVVRARQSLDEAVHPEFQRRGVMEGIRRFCDPQLDFHFGVRSGHPAIRKMNVTLGEGKHTFGTKVEALVRHLGRPEAGKSGPAGDAACTIAEASSFDGRVDELFEEASKPFQFIVVRDRNYLNWRYADPRAGIFTILLAEEHEHLAGYAVISVSRGRGHIADLLAMPGRTDIIQALIEYGMSRFQRGGLSAVECWMPRGHPYQAVLAGLGFVEKRRTLVFNYKPLRLAEEDLEFLRERAVSIHLTSGDTDLV